MRNLRKILFGNTKAIKNTIGRAIEHALREGKIIEGEDLVVRELISAIYQSDRDKIDRKYNAYIRLRNKKLSDLYD